VADVASVDGTLRRQLNKQTSLLSMFSMILEKQLPILKLEHGFRCASIDVDAFATSTACSDLESNQVISRASEYSLYALSKLFKAFVRYFGNKICPYEWMDRQ